MGITAQDESIDPGPTSTGVVGSRNELLSVLHPPHQPGSGKPAYVKRGPGRPRKDNAVGLGKVHKLGLSHKSKNLYGGLQAPSLNRGLQRKKNDGLISAGGTNLAVSLIGELSAINYESPPRGGGEDAAESDTSSVASSLEKLHEDFSLLPEQWPGKVCVFCNLGERSMLGQGDLLRIEIPEGFDPVAVSSGLTVRNKTEKDTNNEKTQRPGFSSRRQKGSVKMKRLISQSSLESINEPVDEVCGYPEEPELNSLFDATSGHLYVHHGCANWCEGVTIKDDGVLFTNLEVEVIRSISQRCLHCGNLGAGVVCKAATCGAVFHLPCAAISGAFQDPCSKTVLCSSHVELAVSLVGDNANCTVCNSPGKISTLILCSNCGNHYHGTCMAINSDPSIRAGWQCPACKMCQACRQPGDESKLLSCDTCDKSYHIFCLRPALSSIPKHSWKCKLCRQCTDCGARTPGSGPSSRWHANFSVCDSCYQQRNKGLACPMCGKAYRHVAQKTMLQCHLCKKYVHGTCDPAAKLEIYQQKKSVQPDYEYICKPCKTNQPVLGTSAGGTLQAFSSSKRTSEEIGFDENSVLNNNTSSQDTMFSPLIDESIQSTENSTDVVWTDKNTTMNSEDKHHQPHPLNPSQHQPKDNKLLNYEAKLHKRKSSGGGSGGGVGGGGRVKGGVDRVCHYSTNSNSRRQKVTELVKKRGPKPKLRMFGSGRMHQRASTDSFPKEGEEPVGVENRMILCSARDEFVLQQDVCVMCGAYGNDLEGRLISCAQCGQCYHPYCVNVKVNRVILTKGWRCLDCTVCEGCGQRNDESRLILCDECDVSFHIYCMDPPLDSVPPGTWKCKWCVVCQYCGSNEPGKNSIWHNNYTTCGPCASYTTCPVCKLEYTEGELIIKCSKCDRWIHASCDSIKDDDDAEKCSDDNYSCVLCRPSDVLPPHLRPPPPPIVTKVENPPKSPDLLKSSSHYVDGVSLSDAGMSHIKSLTLDLPRKKRKKMPNIADMEAGILAAIESVVSGGIEEKSKDNKDDANEKDKEAKNKRQRSLQKLGIGGFVVRIRGPRNKYDDEDLSLDQLVEEGNKPKRKAQRRKVKNKLVENFPVYLQEAFFGKALLEPSSKETDIAINTNDELDDVTPSIKTENVIKLSKEEIKEIEAIKAKQKLPEKLKSDNRQMPESSTQQQQQQVVTDATKDVRKFQPSLEVDDGEIGLDILDGDLLDNDFMDNIMEADDIKVEEGLVDFRGDDSTDFSLDHTSQDTNQKDEFNDILTGQFGLENIDPGLPSMDSKDVEDIFKGVLIEESQETLFSQVSNVPAVPEVPPPPRVNSNPPMPSSTITVSSPSSIMPPHITATGPVQASPGLPRATPQQNLQSPVNFPPPSPYPSEYSNSPQFSPAFSEPPSPWPAAQTEGEADQPITYNQKSLLKLEADEALGPNATTSSVLYANLNHPELKRDYANFSERAKQISKIWRSLSTEKRAPYLQKARENRAANRMQKAQQMPKENKVGDGVIKDASRASHSPDGDAQHLKGPLQTIIKTEMDIDSVNPCGRSPCSHGHDMMIGPSTDSPSMCYSSSPSYSYSEIGPCVQPFSRLVSCNNHSPNNTNSIPPHTPNTHPHHLHPLTSKGGNNSMPSPLYIGGDKDSHPHHKYSFYGAEHHHHAHSSHQHHQHLRTLPPTESCNFSGIMDQEKIASGQSKNVRQETQEERQWKQMQALRQQQQQPGVLPGAEQHKEGGVLSASPAGIPGTPPGMSYAPASPAPIGVVSQRMMPPGSPGVSGGIEHVRQPLQSPHSPSPMNRPPFSTNMTMGRQRPQNMTVAMPPPSPSGVYQARPETVTQNAQNIRGPIYARLPFVHQPPRTPMPMQNDVYGTPPATPQPSDTIPQSPLATQGRQFESESSIGGPSVLHDQFSHNSPLSQSQPTDQDGRPNNSPQTPEAKQHLRGLLQRNQIKRLEQEQLPQQQGELSSQNRPPWTHPMDDPSKLQGIVTSPDGQPISQRLTMPSAPNKPGEFRQPLLPSHVRVPANVAQLSPGHPGAGQRPSLGDFRLGSPGMDPRARILLQQQHRGMLVQPQQQLGPQRPQGFQQYQPGNVPPQSPQIRNSLDPYDHLVVQQQQRMPGVSVSTSSMLAQQLGRPLVAPGQSPVVVSSPQLSPHHTIHSSVSAVAVHQQQHSPIVASVVTTTTPENVPPSASPASATMPDHQELPDSVTEELEKLEQEHNSDHGVEGEPSELADLGMDDDELLGMGDDFNILEYADSELDDVVGGEKTNILDNLDLEEDEKDDGRKDDTDLKDGDKKEPSITPADFASLTVKSSSTITKVSDGLSNQANVSHILSPTNPNFIHTANVGAQAHNSHEPQILRPGQHQQPPPPPPPYPGPPPPYPGRPQMGIRNGCGGGGVIPNIPPPTALTSGLRNAIPGLPPGVGIRPALASPSMSPNANPHLQMTPQRRTLLLQEQPLLLEDLLEQEKREQQKQIPTHGTGLMGAAPEEPLLSDFDFERLKADVLSSSNLPVSLSPPNIVGNAIPTQQPGVFIRSATGQLSQVHTSQPNAPPPQWQMDPGPNGVPNVSQPPPPPQPPQSNPMEITATVSHAPIIPGAPPGSATNQPRMHLTPVPPPPNPPEHPTTEQERQQQVQYEQWLFHQQQQFAIQLKNMETEVTKLRKQRKTINNKIKNLKKNGGQLSEPDTLELERITKELAALQKPLEQARKQSRQHTALSTDYRTKQQKKQQQHQQLLANANNQNQMSPLGPSSASSPLQQHSTPQSPMHMSNSPSMQSGPSPSPLMQHSPMASPLTPSPGPHSSALSQTSPRVVINPGQHAGGQMDDMPFSPTNDPNMRPIMTTQSVRLPSGQQVQMRMASQNVSGGHQQIIVSQQPGPPGGPNQVGNQPGIMIVRGINPNMLPMQHQQQLARMRAGAPGIPGQQDQMKLLTQQRFQRVGNLTQEVFARVKGSQQFPTSMTSMPMSPGGPQQLYATNARVPFPSQSPNAGASMNMNMRSPSPMTPVGGLGSPPSNPNQAVVMQMVQNRVSPASSPMRRPSGSSSIGAPSPMTADRPQSVENPMTPRSTTGSRPHTPLSSNVVIQQQQVHMEGINAVPTSHAPPTSMDSTTGQFSMDTTYSSCAPPGTPTHGEYIVTSAAGGTGSTVTGSSSGGGGGGGGAQNHQILPFPTFSWSDGVHKMGLKGGSPFSVINESVPATTTTNNAGASNSAPEAEVVTQATTITVSTSSGSDLNNDSLADGEPSNPRTSSAPPVISASNVPTNSTVNSTPTVNEGEVVTVKSVLVETSMPVSIPSNSAPITASISKAPNVSVSIPTTTAPGNKPEAVSQQVASSKPPASAPSPITLHDSILTKNSAVAAVAAVVTSIPSSNSNKDTTPVANITAAPSISSSKVNAPSTVVVTQQVSTAPSASPSVNTHVVATNATAPATKSGILPPPPPPISIATTSSIAAAAVAAVVSSVSLQASAKPNATSVQIKTPVSAPKSTVSTAPVTAVKSVPAPIPVPNPQQFIPIHSTQASSTVTQSIKSSQSHVTPSLPQQPPTSQFTQVLQSQPPPQTSQILGALQPQVSQVAPQQQIPISIQPSISHMTTAQGPMMHPSISSHQILTMTSQQSLPNMQHSAPQILASLSGRSQLIGTSSGSTIASAVTFVPPTVTAAPVVVSTLVSTPTSLPPSSYSTVVPPTSVNLVPSTMMQQQTPVAVAFTSAPIQSYGAPPVPHSTPPGHTTSLQQNSTTLIYTTHPNVRMQIAPTSGVSSLSVPPHIQATIQHHQQQQQLHHLGTISQSMIPTSVPIVATQAQHGGGHLLVNETSISNTMNIAGTPIVQQTFQTHSMTPQQQQQQQQLHAQQSQGESQSQNALLKQLLQNTGCASMTQTSENVGFSLTSCLQSRPASVGVPVQHTSHLSEAATRIPHPTPILRPTTPTTPLQSVAASPTSTPLTRPVIKAEPILTDECSQSSTTSTGTSAPISEADVKPIVLEVAQATLDPSKEAILSVVREAAESMLQNQDKSQDSTSGSETATSTKKATDEEAKKLKRRQYQPKRKQPPQSSKESPVVKKRPRKMGRTEEDFDGFLENFMTQLRQLSPIGIVEPELSYNFNVCSVSGCGDFSKLTQKNYSTVSGDLTGAFGKGMLPTKIDFYNNRPYGSEPAKPQPKPQPMHRGFYYQEFATPKMGTFVEKIRADNRTPSPVRETDTPDTIVSASSPECTAWETMSLYPGLKYIDEDMDKSVERCISPEVPLLVPTPIRPVPLDSKTRQEQLLSRDTVKDMDKENKNGITKDVNGTKIRAFTPLKEAGNITVTLMLSSGAAEDIRGLLRNLANVLSIAAPTYQVIDKGGAGGPSAPDQKSHLYTIKGKDGKERIDIQSILNGAAKFCRHCDVVVLNNVIKKRISDFPGIQPTQLNGGDNSDEFYFCSIPCFMNFSITHGVTITEDKAAAIVTHPGDAKNIKTESVKLKDCKMKNKLLEVDSKLQKNKLKDDLSEKLGLKSDKKWKGSRYRNWGSTFMPPMRYKKSTDKEVNDMLFRLGITATPTKIPLDTRKCIFCHQPGDGVSDGPGRLLNFDVDKWIHLNCALWSDNVYETENGGLVNVEMALKQSLTLSCIICNQKGATVKCFKTRCSSVYHLGCATKDGCIFYKNKTIYCPAHIPKGEKENELATLSVYRRVYIQRDENKQVAAVMHHADQHHLLRVGSLIFLNVGQLLPHQLQAFHTPNFIYPIGYKIARFYWSMRKVNKRCQYTCSIHDVDGKPEFRISTQEEGFKEHIVKGNSAQAAWLQILDTISKIRNSAEIIKVFPKYITGEDLFGLTEPSIVKVLESLPGIETLTDYHFKYGRNPLLELPLAINPTGCARSEPKLRTHFKKPHTQRTGPSRSTLNTSTVISSEAACPYSKQFVHSKSSQYKKMKQEWRNNVYLARSKIQGLGLYAARDIEKHTMIIEYIGEIIRPELAELREKRYEAQNRGIYMFRVDENRVIDATLCGGLARYINHSCNPNCVAETVEVDRDHRIIIFANRRISRGEEFSYNYHFAVEELQHKIPCLCGAPNCQQWMN